MNLRLIATAMIILGAISAQAANTKDAKRAPSSNGNLSILEICRSISGLALAADVKETCDHVIQGDRDIDVAMVKKVNANSEFLKKYWEARFKVKSKFTLEGLKCEKLNPGSYTRIESTMHACTVKTGEKRKFKVCAKWEGGDEDGYCKDKAEKILPSYFHFRVDSDGYVDETMKPVLDENVSIDSCQFGEMCAA